MGEEHEIGVDGEPLKKRRAPLTQIDIVKMIMRHHGNIYAMCETEGLNYRSIKKRINSDPELLNTMVEQREIIVDIAEHQTIKNMKAGNQAAANKVMDTWGRDRGWGRQVVEHVGKDEGPIQHDQNVTAAVATVDAPLTAADFDAARRRFITSKTGG